MENIKVHCSYTELVDPEMLVPNPRNPNQHPKRQIELLAKIIQTQGWRAPVTVSNRSGFIVRGHGRLAAAMLLGCKVPVERQDYASEAEEWADLVADNRIAELASIDTEEMARLLSDLSGLDIDIELTGYAGKALDNLLADVRAQEVREDDFDPASTAASIKEPISKRGDVWILGRHRLMCGDSTMAADVTKLMDTQSAALIFTDPTTSIMRDTQRKSSRSKTTRWTRTHSAHSLSTHSAIFTTRLRPERRSISAMQTAQGMNFARRWRRRTGH